MLKLELATLAGSRSNIKRSMAKSIRVESARF